MSLAALKRALRPGMQLTVLDHWIARHRGSVRTIIKVQGNGYWFTQPGDATRYWGPFPKASELKFDGTVMRVDFDDAQHAPKGRFYVARIEAEQPPRQAVRLVAEAA